MEYRNGFRSILLEEGRKRVDWLEMEVGYGVKLDIG